MNTTYIIVFVVFILIVAGIVLGPIYFSRQKKSMKFQDKFGSEYDRTVKIMGNDKKAQTEFTNRQRHVEALNIRPLTQTERERYQADWESVQSKFVDEPGQAIVDADRLIMEVMQKRDYPISDFDQRAADISIKYPALVSDYRNARVIALKNKENKADTEELRQAMIYYRSLFAELLVREDDLVMEHMN